MFVFKDNLEQEMERNKAESKAIDAMITLMIVAAPDGKTKQRLILTQRVFDLTNLLTEYFSKLAGNTDATEQELNESIEYISLAKAGLESFIKSREGAQWSRQSNW